MSAVLWVVPCAALSDELRHILFLLVDVLLLQAAAAWQSGAVSPRGGFADDADADLDPSEAFEKAELARKAAAAGDPGSAAFYAAKKHTSKMLGARQPGAPSAVQRRA